jgi:oligopeptide/dipeptide ABC transporter ATP-binding protein
VTELLVEARGLTVAFPGRRGFLSRTPPPPVQAVSDVDLEVRRGETLAVVGESGCGKSTLGRALLRAVPIADGRLFFRGEDITSIEGDALRKVRRHMQLIFQDPFASLNPRMRIVETVGEPLLVHGIASGKQLRAEVAEMMVAVGLDASVIDRFPHEFSGGQRQRIAIARATILRPDFVVADEPLSALDVSLQLQILKLFDELRKRFGLTYLFISHDLARVFGFADRVAVMYLGKIVEIGPSAQLYARPSHPYTRALIDAVPVPDPKREAGRIVPLPIGEVPSPSNPPSGCRFRTRCASAMPICAEVEPRLRAIDGGHFAACHLNDLAA